MVGQLQGRVAMITGASGSIGSAVAKRFAAEGASLVLVAGDVQKLGLLCNEIQGAGGEAMIAPIDLQDFESIKSLALSVKTKFGVLDALVSSAAVLGGLGPIQECEVAAWKEIMGVNFFANWYLIKCFDSLLKSSQAGRAVFVTSEVTQSLLSYSYFGPYASSKVALEAMVKVYAAESKHSRLCVNMVYPRQVDSNIYTQVFSLQEQFKLVSPESLTGKFVELSSEKCSVTGQIYELVDETV